MQALAYKIGVRFVMLPPNMTSVLQPLDVGVNKIVKSNMRRLFMKHLVENMQDDKSLPSPTRQQVSSWALQAWSEIPRDSVVKAWQRALFTLLDRTSDDIPEDTETDIEAALQPQTMEIEQHAQVAFGFDDEELVEQDEDFIQDLPAPPPRQTPFSSDPGITYGHGEYEDANSG